MRLKSLLVNMMMQIFHKYKEMILYIFFGICTTAVNIVVYYISFYFLSLGTSISTILSWLLSVIFAYLTNKLWVDHKRNRVVLRLSFGNRCFGSMLHGNFC